MFAQLGSPLHLLFGAIRLILLMHVRLPLSLWSVEVRLFERGIDVFHQTVKLQ